MAQNLVTKKSPEKTLYIFNIIWKWRINVLRLYSIFSFHLPDRLQPLLKSKLVKQFQVSFDSIYFLSSAVAIRAIPF